jgi:hypothetical protein
VLKWFSILEVNLWLPVDSWKGHYSPFENQSRNNKLIHVSFPSAPVMVYSCNISSERIIIYEELLHSGWHDTAPEDVPTLRPLLAGLPCLYSQGMAKTNAWRWRRPEVQLLKLNRVGSKMNLSVISTNTVPDGATLERRLICFGGWGCVSFICGFLCETGD